MRITVERMNDTDYGSEGVIEISGNGYTIKVHVTDGANRSMYVYDELGERFLMPMDTPYDVQP